MQDGYIAFNSIKEVLGGVKKSIQNYCHFLQMECEVSQVKEWGYIIYLILKDETGTMKAIVSRRYYLETLTEGDRILLQGELTMYKHEVQISLRNYEIIGIGEVHEQFLKVKKQLEKKGYFDLEKKRPIRNRYRRIGVITSLKAAGFKDMMETFSRRIAGGEVVVYPATVQGKTAPKQVSEALKLANRHQYVQILIIARGGGSKEDLACFNDPMIATEIYQSKIPVATGIGHQIDESIADLAADRAFITPTAAAQGTTIDRRAMKKKLSEMKKELERRFITIIQHQGKMIETFQQQFIDRIKTQLKNNQQQVHKYNQNNLAFIVDNLKNKVNLVHNYHRELLKVHPHTILQQQQHHYALLRKELCQYMEDQVNQSQHRYTEVESKLVTYRKILDQGFRLIQIGDLHEPLLDSTQLEEDQWITIHFRDQAVQLQIKKIIS